ncbi:GNAT family N-acetyltransferase [Dyadobacter sp. CY326]|uniref:GNAT family N-acetyltransferase n=1 Tax=Dyadobacter sp. CY326 TaxID=2907300 RepID=UPI001F2CA66A|nr:GNAT family N-acetyltransferase [Dyadobacter sp. CY326]MCE7065643.1 GNAT family N-acetyltransferase [Dyadobacter sp. CY326]
MFQIVKAASTPQYSAGGELFKEYANSLDFALSYQNFDDELLQLPQMYGPPTGALFLVEMDGSYVGAAGLRRIENEFTCEVKRMYIRPGHQGQGIGKALLSALIAEAGALNYKTIKLDTVKQMSAAVGLYKSFGFKETTPYNVSPLENVLFFEREL